LIIRLLIFWLACGFIFVKLQNNLTIYKNLQVLRNFKALILLKINAINYFLTKYCKQHIWFFANTKANAEKTKRAVSCQRSKKLNKNNMSRLQTIENRLKEINGTVFQELCDSYLTIRDNNYGFTTLNFI
jgi:hypothetical protein